LLSETNKKESWRVLDELNIMPPKISDDECVGCGACIAACPNSVLELVDDKAKVKKAESCDDCKACQETCPTGAVTFE